MLPRISRVECHDADYLLFSTADAITTALFKTGKWEDHLLQISKFFIAGLDSPLILDIGANLGAYSIPLAKHLQDLGGKVIGFEPQRIIYYQLCGNVFLNRLDNYYAINAAVGEVDGEIEIPEIDYEKSINAGAFSLEKKYRELHGIENSIKTASTKVPLVSLNNFAVDKPPALIKIDVEGFELSVLKGATEFLDQNHYPPLLFEAWAFDWFAKDKAALLSFVKTLGYEISNVGTSDYIAQHPDNAVSLMITTPAEGVINVEKVR